MPADKNQKKGFNWAKWKWPIIGAVVLIIIIILFFAFKPSSSSQATGSGTTTSPPRSIGSAVLAGPLAPLALPALLPTIISGSSSSGTGSSIMPFLPSLGGLPTPGTLPGGLLNPINAINPIATIGNVFSGGGGGIKFPW